MYVYSYYGYGFMDQLTDGSAYSGMVTPFERVILGQIKNRSVSRKKNNATLRASSNFILMKGMHAAHCTTGTSLLKAFNF